jgi:hypothetical protein
MILGGVFGMLLVTLSVRPPFTSERNRHICMGLGFFMIVAIPLAMFFVF